MMSLPSPLFEPVQWTGDGFRILDELALPHRIEYIAVHDMAQALDVVQTMKTRAFGQVLTFLYSGAWLAQQFRGDEERALRDQLAAMTEKFCVARPTFDFKGLSHCFSQWLDSVPPDVKVGEWISTQARARAAEIVRAREQRAERAAGMLPRSARLLTHCNVSGELVVIAQFCRMMNKEVSVIATETRPYLQGARLTAWELLQASVPVSLIPDCAVAQVMARGDIDAVLVGSDRCAQNGDIINKVGTYPIAVMAKDYAIPFYALVQPPRSLARGADVTIEERPAAELLMFEGRSLVGECGPLAVRYPAFDVTPAEFVTNFIGFDGAFTLTSFRERYQSGAASSAAESGSGAGNYLLVWGVPGEESYDFLKQALTHTSMRILVPEMRPALAGVGIVRELLSRMLPVTMISDNMMGTLFAQGQIASVCLFYSGLEAAGPRARCGALLAARLARAHGVAVDLHAGGAVMPRAVDRDVATFLGVPVAPPGAAVYPLESEVVPWTLVRDCGGGS